MVYNYAMNLIRVIPLVRSKIAPELTYFTASEIPVGAIVSVPLRSKKIDAIVCDCRPALDLKSEIRKAPFEIRKLGEIKSTLFFPQSFIETSKILADYYATTTGAVIESLVNDSILANIGMIDPPLPSQSALGLSIKKKDWRPSVAVQGDESDRASFWRSLIRQEFARKKSMVIYAPTIEDCDQLFQNLEKGIEGYIFSLNGSLNEKKVATIWNRIAEIEHPIVVIATPSFSVLPRSDIETVGLERENGRGWIGQKSPHLDFRQALELIAKQKGQTVILADGLLRTETLFRVSRGEIEQGSPFKWRSISGATDLLIDLKRNPSSVSPAKTGEIEAEATKKTFTVFSPELEKLIRDNRTDSTHLFLLTTRRGHSPITVCGDCQTIVTCEHCSAPVVLHLSGQTGRNFFMCHHCGERRSANENCRKCDSWKLVPLGIGLDRVTEELREKFPGFDFFKIDSDETKNEKRIKEVLRKFREKPGSILLGTEMALNYLNEKIHHTAVVSLDSLLALPDFRIQEKIMYLLVRLRSLSEKTILVQSRRADEKIFEYGLKGNLSDFHKMTLDERRRFSYPPFSVLVKITIEGEKDKIATMLDSLGKDIEPREMDVFPAFTSTVRGKSIIHGLVKIPSHGWPDAELVKKLRSLSPEFTVRINPESLL